jgi:hypothetical protein
MHHKTTTLCLAWALIVMKAACPNALAQKEDQIIPIEPPFGLQWGESPENVRAWKEKMNYPSLEGKDKTGRDVIEIQGPFKDAKFDRLRFYFRENQLLEVELQFLHAGTPEEGIEYEAINQTMLVKKTVDGRLGTGQIIKNQSGTKNGTKWQFIQQIWTDEEHAVWLALFTAKKPPQGTIAITSLHYRWERRLAEKETGQNTRRDP